MKLIKLLKVNIIVLFILLSSSCCTLICPQRQISDFPVEPKYKPLSDKPVISYDSNKKQYIITENAMDTFLKNKVFLDEVKLWKSENNIR